MQMLLDHNIDILIVDHEQGATALHYVVHRSIRYVANSENDKSISDSC